MSEEIKRLNWFTKKLGSFSTVTVMLEVVSLVEEKLKWQFY